MPPSPQSFLFQLLNENINIYTCFISQMYQGEIASDGTEMCSLDTRQIQIRLLGFFVVVSI